MLKSLNHYNDFYPEDKLPDLKLVRVMKVVPTCIVMQHGLQKIQMNIYYCTCDKEHKYTICEACMTTCHASHGQSEFIESDPNRLATCMCGIKSHKLFDDSRIFHKEDIKCLFHELSFLSQNYDYYENCNNKKKICTFCKIFCCNQSKDAKEFTNTKWEKRSLTREQFEEGMKNSSIKCNCPEIVGSLHVLANYLTKFINDLNTATNAVYFKGHTSLHLLNLFFYTNNLFQYLYQGFLAEFARLVKYSNNEMDFKLDKKLSSSDIFHGYNNFSFMGKNCRGYYYFSENIRRYYEILLISNLLERRFDDHPTVFKFYSALLLGFKKFRIDHDFEPLPKLKIVDFANMNPFQRILVHRNGMYSNSNFLPYNFEYAMKKCSLVDTLIITFEKLVRMRPESVESSYVFIQLSSLIKKFSRFYLISSDQMLKFCNSIDEFFYYITSANKKLLKKGKTRDTHIRSSQMKTVSCLIEILIFFSLDYNDMNISRYLNSNIPIFPFFHAYNELGRVITKNMIHLVNYLKDELEDALCIEKEIEMKESKEFVKKTKSSIKVVNEEESSGFYERKISEELSEMKNIHRFKEEIKKVLLNSTILISMALHPEDIYIRSLKRSINRNLFQMRKLSNQQVLHDPKEMEFVSFLENESSSIEESYVNFFTSPIQRITIANLCEKVIESINKFLIMTSLNEYIVPSNPDIDVSWSLDLKDEEPEVFTTRKGLIVSRKDLKGESAYEADHRKTASYSILLNRSNYIFIVLKVLTFSDDTSLFPSELIDNLLKLLYIFIQNNPDNCVIGLSVPILSNLCHISTAYLDKVLDFIAEALKTIAVSQCEIAYTFQVMKFASKIYKKSVRHSNKAACLAKLLKIFKFITEIPVSNKNQMIFIFRKELIDLWKRSGLISKYKEYLLKISEDYKKNPKPYNSLIDFDNEDIFQNCFKDILPQISELRMGVAFKIYLHFLKLMNYSFDDNALSNHSSILKTVLDSKEVIQILKIKTLHLSLRTELIKFFRMTYIDVSIEDSKMTEYRKHFQKDLETNITNITDSLLPLDEMKIFTFLQSLMSLSGMSMCSPEALDEYELLLFEISHIKEIVERSRCLDDNELVVKYIENGILLPIKVYLNKIFSIVVTLNGRDFLKIYKFCYYLLQTKIYILKENFFRQEPQDGTLPNDNLVNASKQNESRLYLNQSSIDFKRKSVIVDSKLQANRLKEVEDDLKLITSSNFQPLNYLQIYEIITRHIMSLIQNPTSKALVVYFTANKEYQEEKMNGFEIKLRKRGMRFSSEEESKMLALVKGYVDQKGDFKNSSIRSNLNENHNELETNFRTILTKCLLFLFSQTQDIYREGIYAKESNEIILDLLKNETHSTQLSFLELYKIDKEEREKEQIAQNYNAHLNYFAECGFKIILSIIFSQYNPTMLELSDDYFNACHIIKVFKFLCEEHNKECQKIFLKELSFPIEQNKKLRFYDMMLYILDKIIALAGWEKVQCDGDGDGDGDGIDYFYGLFSCIVEMLIEIVQGTDPENFSALYHEDKDKPLSTKNEPKQNELFKEIQDKKLDPIFQGGKALPIFLNNIKCILFNDFSHAETIYKIRKELVDFLLAFMEEYSCPDAIKKIIMASYHPTKIIKSISTVLRKYYLRKIHLEESSLGPSKVKTRLIGSFAEDNVKCRTTNIIIDSHLAKSATHFGGKKEKDKNKKFKRLKFNEQVYLFYSNLYFNDNEFAKTAEFELCSAFYNYFKLTLLQYKYDESCDYWRKIHSLSTVAINQFNIRSNMSESSKMNMSKPIQDESDYEAYYVFKLFEEISKSVFVKIPSSEKPVVVVYTMTPYLKYLSLNSKIEFLRTVNRADRYSKLYELMEQTLYFSNEIEYNWENLRNKAFRRKISELNYQRISFIIFLGAVILNICLLAVLHESGLSSIGTSSLWKVQLASFVFVGIDFFFIIIWCLTKMPLYYEIQKAKFKEKHFSENKLEIYNLSLWDRIKIRIQVIIGKGEITPLVFCIFILVGATDDDLTFLYPISLLSVVSLSKTLSNIALSIVLKARQLLWTLIFTFVILYVWAAWGYFFEVNRYYDIHERVVPEQTCSSLIYCWLTVMNQGLRWHAGIGKILPNESAYNSLGRYVHRWFYDFVFFLLVVIIMLHIVFGIILDTFRELRKKQYDIDKDIANKCFICNMQKDECEKNNRNFAFHCEHEHNVWEYANYMITLRMRDAQDLNSINSYCREQILDKKMKWIPDKKDEGTEEMGDEDQHSEKEKGHNE